MLSGVGVTVFGGLVCGLYVENLDAGHCPGVSYAQASATLSLFFVQFLVLVWWVMVFGFAGGGSLYLEVGGIFVLPYGGGRRHLAPSLVVFVFYSWGYDIWTLHMVGFLDLGKL